MWTRPPLLPRIVRESDTERKLAILLPLFRQRETVLDFGCGDLALASALKSERPFLSITGVDVIDMRLKQEEISYVCYDGERLPFRARSFDTVVSFYVLHHCENAIRSFWECVRVSRKRFIVVESVARSPFEIPFMKLLDWFFNVWKPEPVPLTYQFLTLSEWKVLFGKIGLTLKKCEPVRVLPVPWFLPFGQTYLFELALNKRKS